MSNRYFQGLEGRTMLSGNVGEGTPNPQLVQDRQHYLADIQEYKNDALAGLATLNADKAKIAADLLACSNAKAVARLKLLADTKGMLDALKADGAAGKPVYDQWAPVILADNAAIKADGDNSDKSTNDKAKLASDLASAREAMAPFEAQTKADIAKWNAIIAADKAAIETGGKSCCDQLKADQLKLKNDQTFFSQTLIADQGKISADAAKMKQDGGGDTGTTTTTK